MWPRAAALCSVLVLALLCTDVTASTDQAPTGVAVVSDAQLAGGPHPLFAAPPTTAQSIIQQKLRSIGRPVRHVRFIAEPVRISGPPMARNIPVGASMMRFAPAAASTTATPAASTTTTAASSSTTTTTTAAATQTSSDDEGDWLTTKNGTLRYGRIGMFAIIFILCAGLCFIYSKYIAALIACIEQSLYMLFVVVSTPFRWIRAIIVFLIYPVKELICGIYDKIYYWCYPYRVVS